MKKQITFACLLSLMAAPALAGGGSSADTGTNGSYQQGSSDQSATSPMSQGGGVAQGDQRLSFGQLDLDGDGSLSRDEAMASGMFEGSTAGGGSAGGSASADAGTDSTVGGDTSTEGHKEDVFGTDDGKDGSTISDIESGNSTRSQ